MRRVIVLILVSVGTLMFSLPALGQTGSISGRVVNVSGDPVPYVLANAYDLNKNWVAGAPTDTNGNYQIPNVPSGTYKVWFNPYTPPKGGYLSQWYNHKESSSDLSVYVTANVLGVDRYPNFKDFDAADPVTINAGSNLNINVVLDIGGKISGKVTAVSGAPIADALVYVSDLANRKISVAKTDAKGDYIAPAIPSGDYTVFFFHPRMRPVFTPEYYNNKESLDGADVVSVVRGQVTPGINAVLSPPFGAISGRVASSTWQVIPNATVKVDDIPVTFDIRDGHFEAGMILVGPHTVYYDAPGYQSQTQYVEIKKDQTTQLPTCLLSPIGTVARATTGVSEILGRVVNQSWQTIPGTAVRINNVVIPTNPGGEFRFTLVYTGVYTIYYDAPGYVGQTQVIEVMPGQTARPPTVIMSKGVAVGSTTGEIFGKVVNQAGQMIPGTCIRINTTLMPTNSAGEFRFTLVHPGIYRIFYDAPGYKGQTQVVEVKADQVTRSPTVIMGR